MVTFLPSEILSLYPTTLVFAIAACQFVARYLLKDYYHHGRTLDSLLQSTGQSLESGREMLAEMKEREETAVRQFTKVIKTLELPEEPADQQIDS